MIIGLLILAAGWGFQTTVSVIGFSCSFSSATCGNAGTVLQLIGTLCVIVGVVILAVGFLKFVRRVERYIYSHP